jgi:TRAP transporter TAXI family solute receptor
MKRMRGVALVALAVAMLMPSSELAAQPRRHVIIASGWVVGVYYSLAGGLSRIAYNAADLNVRATVEASGASVANAQLVGAGDADLALLQNDIAYYAYTGTALPAFAGKPVKTMTGVFTIYPELVHIVAGRATGVKSVRDLKGRRVVLGPPGSGTEQNALQVLHASGLKESDLGKAERMEGAPAAEQIKGGRLDAAFFTTGFGSAVLVDIFASGQAVLVPVAPVEGDALRRSYPFYTAERIPANTYKGQAQEVTTVGVMAMLAAHAELPEDLVYRFTRAIFANLGQLQAADAAAKNLTLQTALNGMPIPLHPGAAKFYREKGVGR